MQVTKDSNHNAALRRAVKETVLLGVIFLIALFLFFTTVHFIATREAAYELKDRPRGLILGGLTAIAIGLILGKTRQATDTMLPKSLMIIIRGSLQAMLLLLFSGVLCYTAYFLYTVRGWHCNVPGVYWSAGSVSWCSSLDWRRSGSSLGR